MNIIKSLILSLFSSIVFLGQAQTFTSGNTYLDSNSYIEYHAGNLPIILSSPHGGYLEPDSIPLRDCDGCVYQRDYYTQELTRGIQEAIITKTGCYPHMVINLLHRNRLDANRDIIEAADSNTTVEASWRYFHRMTDTAKTIATRQYGKGLYIDMHAHAHSIQRLEIGHAVWKSDLQQSDNHLNSQTVLDKSTIKNLASDNINNLSHAQLIRGEYSLGTLMHESGFPSVPSSADSFPLDTQLFFTGGYDVKRHGSRNGGTIDAIQIECNQSWRFTSAGREAFIDSASNALIEFVKTHYFSDFKANYCNKLLSTSTTSLESFSMYPNPAHNTLYINSRLGNASVTIYNNLGILVFDGKLANEHIDISELPSGIYNVRISNAHKSLSPKAFVKQ
ncbi:MAG: T9SS type A sorting domain-containing protein [Bacteroidia bacterium]